MEGSDLVRGVTSGEAFDWPQEDPGEFGIPTSRRAKRRLKIAAYDYGMKWNIMRRLSAHGCDVRVYPASAPASEVLDAKPDGVFLSNVQEMSGQEINGSMSTIHLMKAQWPVQNNTKDNSRVRYCGRTSKSRCLSNSTGS